MRWTWRRRDLAFGAAAGLGGCATLRWAASAPDGCDDASTIGARYAHTYARKADELAALRDTADDAEWARRLQAARLRDINAGNLVEVEGWWLAETELLICVLAYRARSDRLRQPLPPPC